MIDCENCNGEGVIEFESGGAVPGPADGYYQKPCDACDGTGEVEGPLCEGCGEVLDEHIDVQYEGGFCNDCI